MSANGNRSERSGSVPYMATRYDVLRSLERRADHLAFLFTPEAGGSVPPGYHWPEEMARLLLDLIKLESGLEPLQAAAQKDSNDE